MTDNFDNVQEVGFEFGEDEVAEETSAPNWPPVTKPATIEIDPNALSLSQMRKLEREEEGTVE